MLGKLTRWLRILGQDVKYSNKLDDAKLISISEKERRVLLTRDTELYRRAMARGIDVHYLRGQTGEEKLAELSRRFDVRLEIDMSTSRCPKCNSKVKPTNKEEVIEKVEKNTFMHYDEFWKCPRCEQIYWQGAHWIGIKRKLAEANDFLRRFREQKDVERDLTYSRKEST